MYLWRYRQKHQEKIEELKKRGRPIVHIDESGFVVDACRHYGYS